MTDVAASVQAARVPQPARPAYPRFIVRVQFDATFAPCPVEDGNELFANGIFVFNVTRILEHVARHPAEIALDLTRPVLLAEISPGSFNLIDGHHRIEKARRSDVETLPAYRLIAAQHVRFLTSTRAYLAFVGSWNGKVGEAGEDHP